MESLGTQRFHNTEEKYLSNIFEKDLMQFIASFYYYVDKYLKRRQRSNNRSSLHVCLASLTNSVGIVYQGLLFRG